MNAAAPQSFTAAQIAAALGLTRRAVLLRLEGMAPDGLVKVRGQNARAWSLAALPESMHGELAAAAQRRGCATVAQLLADPPATWQPAKPWHEIPQAFQDRAARLCTALAPVLARQHQLAGPDLMDLARAGYRRQFGNDVSDDRLRYVMDRATIRDNGFNRFQVPALYLDDADFRKKLNLADSEPLPIPTPADASSFSKIDEQLASIRDKTKLSALDQASLMDAAFQLFESQSGPAMEKGNSRALKSALVEHLYLVAPGLYRPQVSSTGAKKPLLAIRRLFNRLYTEWVKHGKTVDSILDQRPTASGRKSKEVPPDDFELIVETTVALDDNLAGALRRLHQIGALSNDFRKRFPFDPQNKSYVHPAVRMAVMAEVRNRMPSRRGPHYTKSIAPKAARDWSKVAPYDWLGLDDVTFNHPFAIRDVNGNVRVVRGECILASATRVGYIVHYTLIAGVMDGQKTSFNSWHVRGHVLAVHDKIGLPHVGLDLEHNVFAARLIRGEQRPHWHETDGRHFEHGLRHAGLELHYHHPGTPWTKPIERVIGMVQDRMDCEPLYVGRNERLDRREHAQKAIRAVESGKATPEEVGMLWFDQFARLLDAVMPEYNREVQNGEMLMDDCGLYRSPEDAFINGICGQPGTKARPAKQLAVEGRARLSTHQRKMYVGDRGLNIEIDGRRYPFFDENLEPFRHKDVLVYLNMEHPEVLICSDLKQTKFFQVKLHRYDAMDAAPADLKTMNRDRADFMARSRTIQSKIVPPVISIIARDKSITQETAALAQVVNPAVEHQRIEQAASVRERHRRASEDQERLREVLAELNDHSDATQLDITP